MNISIHLNTARARECSVPNFLDLKKKLDELEAKMAMLKESGYERELQRQSIIYEDLKPAVDALEAIQKEEGTLVGETFLSE